MKDANPGVYFKFLVERTDGKSAPGEKHFGCQYFVLDCDHDPYAKSALLAYADACQGKFPKLAEDARRMANGEKVLITDQTFVKDVADRTSAAIDKARHSLDKAIAIAESLLSALPPLPPDDKAKAY